MGQSLITWCQGNNDDYPLPSRVDKANYTLTLEGRAKDTTSNIYSMLVFNGATSTDVLVSPSETNRHVEVYKHYEFDRPTGTAHPLQATWDPKLSSFLDGAKPGNVSYAHLQPSGERKRRWSNTFAASEIVLSTRGPEVTSSAPNLDGSVRPTFTLPSSNTLRFYGRGKTWSGWFAFNDHHTEFRDDYIKSGRAFGASQTWSIPMYQNTAGKRLPDLFSHDEPDDPKSANDFLGIFLKAGDTPADFKAAWD